MMGQKPGSEAASMGDKKKSAKRLAVPGKGAGEVLVMRHGERVDRVFSGWIKKAFDAQGHYLPYDLNLPASLPRREPTKFRNDGPITEVGVGVAKLVGRGLRLSGLKLGAVYASPSLRCVQTAAYVLRHAEVAEETSKRIRVEPGLFEAMGWYELQPSFLPAPDLVKAGYPIAADYKPILSLDDLAKLTKETNAAYHDRSLRVITKLAAAHAESDTILIVGHAPTLDIAARVFSGEEREGRSRDDLDQQGSAYPFGALLALRRPPGSPPSKPYSIHTDVVPPLSATRNHSAHDVAFLDRA